MVDLHTHTDRSDGTLSPNQLIDLAERLGLKAVAITDHDSLEGYDLAQPYAQRAGVELVCGIELSTKYRDRSIHVLGYFLEQPPGEAFRGHLACLQEARRERNGRLTERLRQLGLSIRLEDAEKLGRSQTGRPHFAQLLVNRGYVSSIREAFKVYLDESAPGYVERRDPSLENVLRWIREAGGISSWAHPGRAIREAEGSARDFFEELGAKGLDAVEVYHVDHTADEMAQFRSAAENLGLGITGGSDFHGTEKGRAQLGALNLPSSLLEALRTRSRRVHDPIRRSV